MIEFARVKGGAVIERRYFDDEEIPPVLAASKGRWIPVVPVPAVVDERTQVLGDQVVTLKSGQVEISYPVRTKTVEEVLAMRQAKIVEIKAQASARILALYPSWKQANMLARGVELTHKRFDDELTAEEDAEVVALQGCWDQVRAIRSRSDDLEAAVPNDAVGIFAIDAAAGWD